MHTPHTRYIYFIDSRLVICRYYEELSYIILHHWHKKQKTNITPNMSIQVTRLIKIYKIMINDGR